MEKGPGLRRPAGRTAAKNLPKGKDNNWITRVEMVMGWERNQLWEDGRIGGDKYTGIDA
jgi:hypothetical protein